MKPFVLVVLTLGAFVVGCNATVNVDGLRSRAAYDFQCPQAQLELTELVPGVANPYAVRGAVYGVQGCGRRATYISTEANSWVMNTASGKTEKAAH